MAEPGADRVGLVRLRSCDRLPTSPRPGTLVDARAYSRFKHGDGEPARRFAVALAAHAAPRLGAGPVLVTSSAAGRVPPAAHSLLAPFVTELRALRPQLQVTTFEVARHGVSNGDYARMSPAQRRDAIDPRDLTPGRDVAGGFVLALDDIRVTGHHERALDRCLLGAGADTVRHLYVVDASGSAAAPQVESLLNEAAIGGAADLLDIAASRGFVPNARLCRRVLALSRPELADFVTHAQRRLLDWLDAAMEHDGLGRVPAYRDRVRVWDEVRAEAARRELTAG